MKTHLSNNNLLNALVELDIAVKAMPTINPKPNLLPLLRALTN
jgi:hypothetical protein